MNKISRRKIWVLLLSVIALAALVALAAGIGQMEFKQPTGTFDDIFVLLGGKSTAENVESNPWGRFIYWILMLIMFLLMLGPIRPQTGKSLAQQIIRITGIFVAALFLFGMWAKRSGVLNPYQSQTSQVGTPVAGTEQMAEFQAPAVSGNLELLVTGLVALGITILAVFLYARFAGRFHRSESQPLGEIAQAAQTALDEISTGEEWKNAIVRCYGRMNAAVRSQRGMQRDADVTPSEFALHLQRAGLPREAVDQLTKLFERVRYGSHQAGQDDIQIALTCLNDILTACETVV